MNAQVTRREFNQIAAVSVAALVARSSLYAAENEPNGQAPLRIGFIGVGGRGTGLLQTALAVSSNLLIPAVCDIVEASAQRAAEIAVGAGLPRPTLYTKDEQDWRNMLRRGDLDAVIIATPWQWHATMGIEAMKAGAIPGIEVPCALSVEECWQLVDTSEQTGIPCMMLENWSFRPDNLALLNMVRKGLFGSIVHVHCAHSHDCIDHWFFDANTGADRWAAQFLLKYNRDQYPTHSLGPVLSWCDINCGDRFKTIVSTATDEFGIRDMFIRRFGPDHPGAKRKYAQGDIVTSVIRTEKGKTIVVNYDMQLPRPYDNRWMLQGTRGIYSEERESIYLVGRSPQYHQWEPFAPYQAQYEHIWWAEGGVGGHGGVDGVMLRCFLEAARKKQPLPLDVYDSVTMSAVVALSGESIAAGGKPVEFPDFTRGKWETTKPKFAIDDRDFAEPQAVTMTADGMSSQTLLLGLPLPAIALNGVSVRLTGEPKQFTGWASSGGQPRHCLYSENDWGIQITVPKGSSGKIAVYAYAPDGKRKQAVTFCERHRYEIDDLTRGRWLEFPFTAQDSAGGILSVSVHKIEGANCVLSKLRIDVKVK